LIGSAVILTPAFLARRQLAILPGVVLRIAQKGTVFLYGAYKDPSSGLIVLARKSLGGLQVLGRYKAKNRPTCGVASIPIVTWLRAKGDRMVKF